MHMSPVSWSDTILNSDASEQSFTLCHIQECMDDVISRLERTEQRVYVWPVRFKQGEVSSVTHNIWQTDSVTNKDV